MFTSSREIDEPNVYGMGKPKRVTAVRLDDDPLRIAEAMASERRMGVSTFLRQVFDAALGMRPGEPPSFRRGAAEPPSSSAPGFFPAPLLAEDVGAGAPRLRMIPGADRRYGFREDWLSELDWTPDAPDRFGVYRLADLHARSMEPTIQSGSILLVDRDADRDAVPHRSIWIVSRPDGLACKRVTVRDGWLVLESDNRDPEFAPEALRLTAAARRTMLEGRVVWWATTADAA